MITIAVVEDRPEDSKHLTLLLDRYFEMSNAKYDISVFESGEAFFKKFTAGKFDIVFMDKLTGVDTAELVRKTDKECRIIFITTDNSFATESYKVHAAGYMIKPVKISDITSIMDRILSSLSEPYISVELVDVPSILKIRLDSIVYAETKTRYTELHLITTTVNIRSSCVALLGEYDCFLQCYRGIYINMNHIKKTLDNDFLTDTEELVPIRKRESNKIKKLFLKYSISKI